MGFTCKETHKNCILLPQKGKPQYKRGQSQVECFVTRLFVLPNLHTVCAHRIDNLPHWPGLMTSFPDRLLVSFMDGWKLEHLLIVCAQVDSKKTITNVNP